MPRKNSKNIEEFAEFLDKAVILVAGENDGYIDPHAEEVHVAIVVNVTGYGPHTGAIYVDQNRFHASSDESLQEAYSLLEEWERDHNPDYFAELEKEHGDEASSVFTETFDGRTWTLPAEAFCDAIYGTAAEKFIDVLENEDDEDEDEDEEGDDEDEGDDEG